MSERAVTATVAASVLAVFWVVWPFVSPVNFGGWDEWLVVDLTARGTISLPYQNRPFSLLFNWPGALLLPGTLSGYWLVHGLYLSLAGVCLVALIRRLAPEEPRLALLAGAFCVTWVPLDRMRLDAVLVASYSGFTLACMLTALLLQAAGRRGSWAWLFLSATLAFAVIRGLESTAGLVLGAPALLWLAPDIPPQRRRCFALAYWLPAAVAVAMVARPLLPGQPASYQVSGLGFDPDPLRVGARLLHLLAFQLRPLIAPQPRDLLHPQVVLAVLAWGAACIVLTRARPACPQGPRRLLRLASVGMSASALGHAVLALSPATATPARTQILSAPGMGLFLAASALLASSMLSPRRTSLAAGLLGGAVVALGAGRTAALQADWDSSGYWRAQSDSLAQMVRLAPGFRPGTFVLLLDEARAFPASFTFRHAVRFLYGDEVAGAVWGAEPFLYPTYLGPTGLLSAPYPMIREPWGVPARLHPFDEIVVFRLKASGTTQLERAWPEELPALPAEGRYDPAARVDPSAAQPTQAVLRNPGVMGRLR